MLEEMAELHLPAIPVVVVVVLAMPIRGAALPRMERVRRARWVELEEGLAEQPVVIIIIPAVCLAVAEGQDIPLLPAVKKMGLLEVTVRLQLPIRHRCQGRRS